MSTWVRALGRSLACYAEVGRRLIFGGKLTWQNWIRTIFDRPILRKMVEEIN
jgi:hypothetical protein